MLKLYHYSNADIKDYIKPDYYGLNNYTNNDKNITNIKRAFFYTKPEPEILLKGSNYCYIAIYPNFRIYDITADRKGFLVNRSISEALYKIKQVYNGVRYKIGSYEVVNLFYKVKFTEKTKLY